MRFGRFVEHMCYTGLPLLVRYATSKGFVLLARDLY